MKYFTEDFRKLAQDICIDLSRKQYGQILLIPLMGKPYYGPSTLDSLFETDERFRYFGINVVDLNCYQMIEHFQHGKRHYSRIRINEFCYEDSCICRISILISA